MLILFTFFSSLTHLSTYLIYSQSTTLHIWRRIMFHISPFLNEMCLQYLDHFSASIILFFRSKSSDDFADKKRQKQKSRVESICNNFFSISEFSYKLIRLLLNSSVVKSDNEMSKFSYKVIECPRRTRPMPLIGRNSSIMWVCSYL